MTSVVNLMQSLQNLHRGWTFFGVHSPAAFHQASHHTMTVPNVGSGLLPCCILLNEVLRMEVHEGWATRTQIVHDQREGINIHLFVVVRGSHHFRRSVSEGPNRSHG